jgi:exodeoxyribonuclease V alpha subunit
MPSKVILDDYRPRAMEGVVERFRVRKKDTGWGVIDFHAANGKYYTVTGVFPSVQEGDRLEVRGAWVSSKWGVEFKAKEFTLKFGEEGLFQFLRRLKQIGPKRARAIMDKFGDDALDVVKNAPERLLEIKGITPDRVSLIQVMYGKLQQEQDALLFLQSLKLSSNQIDKLLRTYNGAELREAIETNPYQLVGREGVTFKMADDIAHRIGHAPDSMFRIRAGCLYSIELVQRSGHSYAFRKDFLRDVSRLLALAPDKIEPELGPLAVESLLVLEEDRIYGPQLHRAEQDVASNLRRLWEGGR